MISSPFRVRRGNERGLSLFQNRSMQEELHTLVIFPKEIWNGQIYRQGQRCCQ